MQKGGLPADLQRFLADLLPASLFNCCRHLDYEFKYLEALLSLAQEKKILY